MRRHILFILLTLTALSVRGQLTPVHNVASPEAGTLGMFGSVPVSQYTGQPDISIPLYEVNAGNFTLPLTARYHLSSVKPHMPPTTLGLGWVLDAGGYISRTVRGIMDEKMSDDGQATGFYAHHSKMKNITENSFRTLVSRMNPQSSGESFEISADEFSFSFCGYSGNFYMNADGGWTVVSDDDIKVEFNEEDGFVDFNFLRSARNLSGWGGKSYCNRFFCKFTLVTPDGCKYVFGGTDAMELSIPYYSRDNSDLTPTTWRLSGIITPEGREVSFTYKTDQQMCVLRHVPQEITERINSGDGHNGQDTNSGYKGFTGFLLFPVALDKIITPNETLTFIHQEEEGYGQRFCNRNDAIKCLYWNSSELSRHDLFKEPFNSHNQFLTLINTSKGSGDNNFEKIKTSLKHYQLDAIAITPKGGLREKKIVFDYIVNNGRRKLHSITCQSPSSSQSDDAFTYRFTYNRGIMPYNPAITEADKWGYNTGTDNMWSMTVPVLTGRSASLSSTLAETLHSVRYPTGGITSFEYELNTYAKKLSADRNSITSFSSSSTAGGLRVARIVNRNEYGDTINSVKYSYAHTKGSELSSGILQNEPVYEMLYSTNGGDTIRIKSKEGFSPSSTNFNTPDVGYSSIFEETFDRDNRSTGFIHYRYSNFDADIYGQPHYDEPFTYAALNNGKGPTIPFTSHSTERGRLLSKEYFKSDGTRVRKENVHYSLTQGETLWTASQGQIVYSYNTFNIQNTALSIFGWLTKTYTHSYLPDRKTVTEYFVSGDSLLTSSYYTYNSRKMLAADSTINSKGSMTVNKYRYITDDNSSKYQWMRDGHFTSKLLMQTTTSEGKTKTITNDYGKRLNGSSEIPYLQQVRVQQDQDSAHTVYEVIDTDEYGNPTDIIDYGVPVTMQWGNEGQRLTRKVVGCHSYNLTENLPTYNYQYDNTLRLTSSKEPGKPNLQYEYDFMGRLINIIQSGKNEHPLKRYEYEYQQITK